MPVIMLWCGCYLLTLQVAIIGAGVAGLVCARILTRGGFSVRLLEASDGVGGRVRTDEVEGFLLDRGFQVMSRIFSQFFFGVENGYVTSIQTHST